VVSYRERINQEPLFDNSIVKLYQADATLLPIPDQSVDCVVTSPPYWGLRDYGTGSWEGGSEGCDHIGAPHRTQSGFNERWYGKQFQEDKQGSLHEPYKDICGKCGAKRVDKQIGLEPSPDEYCAKMVDVFREVWRVLKPTGTVWLNLGDTYSAHKDCKSVPQSLAKGTKAEQAHIIEKGKSVSRNTKTLKLVGLKNKDLIGIPWRVAFALQADGWYLRSDIIWSKPNPMPESVQDRPTKAHEYIFLLTKSPKYYYDADAIREDVAPASIGRLQQNIEGQIGTTRANGGMKSNGNFKAVGDIATGRNKRTVWEITTHPYAEAHFATYPEKLVEPCILAGTSEKGVCAVCGKPWERTSIVTNVPERETRNNRIGVIPKRDHASRMNSKAMEPVTRESTGWQPTCECNADIVPATVLDPFAGSGTTLVVAQRLGRYGIGTDLKKDYLSLAIKRLTAISMPMNMGI
jgi:DNA modification methylase